MLEPDDLILVSVDDLLWSTRVLTADEKLAQFRGRAQRAAAAAAS